MIDVEPADHYLELAARGGNGIDVALYWCRERDELIVCVVDDRSDAYFEIMAPRDRALDVFEHPYAYLAFDVHEARSDADLAAVATDADTQ